MNHLRELLYRFTDKNHGISSKQVDAAVEHVVDSIDVKLRLVPAYKQKIHGSVSKALRYIDQLVEMVPGPINFSRSTYTSDSEVRAYFASPDIMQQVFSGSEELQVFFSDPANRHIDTCYALLCANKQDKTIIGSELVGDFVRHDIMQTSINFFDYKVLSPSSSDYEVRKGIKQCIFDGLITHALQHIAGIKSRRRDLHNQQRILHAQLRARQSRGGGLSSMLAQGHASRWKSDDVSERMNEAGRTLETMLGKQDVFSFYLNEIKNILSRPDEFLRLNVACFRLTDMRIMVRDDSPQSANTVCFSEIEIANIMKRVVAVVSYSRSDM